MANEVMRNSMAAMESASRALMAGNFDLFMWASDEAKTLRHEAFRLAATE
jgi:hypothetical protein